METDTALVGADYVVVLYTVSHIGLHLTLVIHPCYAELIHSVGNAQAFNQVGFIKLGVLVVFFFNGSKYLFYSLVIFRLIGEASFQVFQNFFSVHNVYMLF